MSKGLDNSKIQEMLDRMNREFNEKFGDKMGKKFEYVFKGFTMCDGVQRVDVELVVKDKEDV